MVCIFTSLVLHRTARFSRRSVFSFYDYGVFAIEL